MPTNKGKETNVRLECKKNDCESNMTKKMLKKCH